MPVRRDILEKETIFKPALSSGKGGQHVNKVATRAQLFFPLTQSEMFTEDEMARLMEKLAGKITRDGYIIVSSQTSRSLLDNRINAFDKLEKLLVTALTRKKKRVPTKQTKAARERRLKSKKQRSEIKRSRKPDW